MRHLLVTLLVCVGAVAAQAQWVKQTVNTTANFRGLSVVSERVVWASGTGGTVVRTVDGGKTWDVITVPGAETLDFRDIEAFDAQTAYILSIGNGESSRIYKTVDGGKTWKLQRQAKSDKAFFDAMACWDVRGCAFVTDPIDEKFRVFITDGGEEWSESRLVGKDEMPRSLEGEAAFAASGTCLVTIPGDRNALMLVSGGTSSRVFRSDHRGLFEWNVFKTKFTQGSVSKGIFSISMRDTKNGVIVGGDYQKPHEAADNVAFTSNGGKTWKLGSGLNGYRSGVALIEKNTYIAVGTNGVDRSTDGGRTWQPVSKDNLNVVQSKGPKATWAVGPKGLVMKLIK